MGSGGDVHGDGERNELVERLALADDVATVECLLAGYDGDGSSETADTETRLQLLQRATNDLIVATAAEEIAEITLTATREVLELPVSSLWRYDEEADCLQCLKQTERARELFGAPPTFQRGEGLVWNVFERDDIEVYDDLRDHEEVYNPETPLRSELIVSVGDYGVIMAASTDPSNFTDVDVDMARILASTVEASFERLDRERQLRERERDLSLLDQLLTRVLRHDLRNKLHLIRSHTERLSRDTDGTGDTSGEPIEAIFQVTSDLIETSKKARQFRELVERDPPVVEQNLRDVVQQAVDAVDLSSAESVDVDVPPDCTVMAVPKFVRAVENLLDNAVAYGGDEPTVSVTACREDDRVVLAVVDDGPGIRQHEVDVLRQREEHPLSHGTGMGLWVVDRIVDESGGRLSFDSEDGTRAEIRLDVAES